MAAADLFECPSLADVARNILEGNADLNPSIGTRENRREAMLTSLFVAMTNAEDWVVGTWLNDENGKKAKELFFKQSNLTDVAFKGKTVSSSSHCD